jgi:hypothetical protein
MKTWRSNPLAVWNCFSTHPVGLLKKIVTANQEEDSDKILQVFLFRHIKY